MEKKYDIIILGGGPAGLSSAIYAVRYGLRTILISRDIGGTANLAHLIENYPGYNGSGRKLMQKFYNHAKSQGAEFLDDDIIDLRKNKREFLITTTREKISGKAIIIALGTQKRKLNIPGEDKFVGKGVSYCATCDAFFFKKKNVAIIGGGDSACKAALLLSGMAKKVYLIHRREKERCEVGVAKKLRLKKNIEYLNNSSPFEIKGKHKVSELIFIRNNSRFPKQERLKVDGIFVEIGGMPVSDIAKLLKVNIDELGHIHVDSEMNTNIHGVFAAGDVVKSKLKQVVVAASQGAIAAKSAYDFISKAH